MNNLRDLLGYALDFVDVWIVRHRRYGYCRFVARMFSGDETFVSRVFERLYKHEEI